MTEQTPAPRYLAQPEQRLMDAALRRSTRPVDGMRTLTFTLDQVRAMLIAAWFADPPVSAVAAEREADRMVQAAWHEQQKGAGK